MTGLQSCTDMSRSGLYIMLIQRLSCLNTRTILRRGTTQAERQLMFWIPFRNITQGNHSHGAYKAIPRHERLDQAIPANKASWITV